jgi:hypothetical protein
MWYLDSRFTSTLVLTVILLSVLVPTVKIFLVCVPSTAGRRSCVKDSNRGEEGTDAAIPFQSGDDSEPTRV